MLRNFRKNQFANNAIESYFRSELKNVFWLKFPRSDKSEDGER
jgi:hypothetical protein